MGQQTAIGYVDHTWTGIRGCKHATLPNGTPHSGCDNCFAEAQAKRNPATLGTWGEGGTRVRGADSYWKLPLKWNRAAEDRCESTNGHGDRCTKRAGHKGTHQLLRPTGPMGWGDDEPRPRQARVLWDLGDLFEDWQGLIHDHKGARLVNNGHDQIYHVTPGYHPLGKERPLTMDDCRRDVFDLIDQTPNLIWMVPTKRPWNVRRTWIPVTDPRPDDIGGDGQTQYEYRDNVWLGVSVSDQHTWDVLVAELAKLSHLSPCLWVSIEPLLGPINMRLEDCYCPEDHYPLAERLGGIVIGGESGSTARGCDVAWIRWLVRQSEAADVPCYVKQLGAKPFERQGNISNWPTGTRVEFDNDDTIIRIDLKHKKGADTAEWPDDLKVQQVPQPGAAA